VEPAKQNKSSKAHNLAAFRTFVASLLKKKMLFPNSPFLFTKSLSFSRLSAHQILFQLSR
jgi:hypothetical protein